MTHKPMSRINQIAYMVPELHAAIDWWTQVMGVGPFFIFPPFDVVKGDYRGQAHVAEFGAAIAYPDIVSLFMGSALNNTGQAIEIIAMTLATDLVIGLAVSAFMNWYNARIALVTR